MEVFDLENVSYSYRDGKKALNGISMTVKKGEAITIIGTNGSGKSTLLFALDGLIGPEEGSIRFFGLPKEEAFPKLRQKISLLFQDPHAQLFSLSVWDELCLGPAQMGLSQNEIRERVEDIMSLLNIRHLRDSLPWNLSGGEMKKVALGVCLTTNPDVLLLDEPTSGLDPRSQVELIDVITALIEHGKTIITATHDLGIIQDISERTIVLGEDHGVLIEGKPWEVIKDSEALLKANLIHKHAHRHSWYVHEHSHAGAHDHEHIPEMRKEIIHAIGKEELKRLNILIEHWKDHNMEHARTYMEWADRLGEKNISQMLKEIARETIHINLIFERLQRIIQGC